MSFGHAAITTAVAAVANAQRNAAMRNQPMDQQMANPLAAAMNAQNQQPMEIRLSMFASREALNRAIGHVGSTMPRGAELVVESDKGMMEHIVRWRWAREFSAARAEPVVKTTYGDQAPRVTEAPKPKEPTPAQPEKAQPPKHDRLAILLFGLAILALALLGGAVAITTTQPTAQLEK